MRKIITSCFSLLLTVALFGQNRALHFDGADDHIVIADNPSVLTGTAFTFEAWMKPELAEGQLHSIVNKGNSYAYSFHMYLETMGMMPGMPDDGMPVTRMLMCDILGADMNLYRVAYEINESFYGNWHHVAATYSGNTFILYVDGMQVSSTYAYSGLYYQPGTPVVLGVYEGMWNYAGTLDEVRIWNRARTAEEIQNNRSVEQPSGLVGLVAYYKFNQGTADDNNGGISTATDASSFGNHGDIFNFTLNGTRSNFTGGYPTLTVLPLSLTLFTAREENGSVLLKWKTADRGISYFDVERSTDGASFIRIGSVSVGASVEASVLYSFTDPRPLPGVNVYRLKSTQANGKREYSRILTVKRTADARVAVYPNPASDIVQVQATYTGELKGYVQNAAGFNVKVLDFPHSSARSTNIIRLDVSSLPSGTYFIRVAGEIVKFIKQ